MRGNVKFNVTRKGIQTSERQFLWRASGFHIVLGILSVIGLSRVILAFVAPELISLNPDSVLINLFWVLYNFIGIVLVLMIFFERPRYRTAERFLVTKNAAMTIKEEVLPVQVIDLNEYGARLSIDSEKINKKLILLNWQSKKVPLLHQKYGGLIRIKIVKLKSVFALEN